MIFSSSYPAMEGVNTYSQTDSVSFYPQSNDISGVIDPTLGEDAGFFTPNYSEGDEPPPIRRYLEENDTHRLWEPSQSNWDNTFSMGMPSYSATPTLESNDRSSSPGSPPLFPLPPNTSQPVTQGNSQWYGGPQRPLTPVGSVILSSAPGAFAEDEHINPQSVLVGLASSSQTNQEGTCTSTIYVQPPHQISSTKAGLALGTSPCFSLKELGSSPKDALGTVHTVSLMSPPMQPHSLPKVRIEPPSKAGKLSSNPRNTRKNKRPKQVAKATRSGRISKPGHPSTSKSNPIRDYSNSKAILPIDAFGCKDCNFVSRDQLNLDKHVKSTHGRLYICIFQFAGCPSKFPTKNEWKRHVLSQHLVLKIYNCTLKDCGDVKGIPGQSQTTYMDIKGKQFNRKDLYDSHMRRMHDYPPTKKNSQAYWAAKKMPEPKPSIHERCKLPTRMKCPDAECSQVFEGEDAWDQRMEHVARHMEKAAVGDEAPLLIGSSDDHTLLEWAASSSVGVIRRVAGKWELRFPTKENRPVRTRVRK